MLGAAIAARDGKLLTLATGEFLPKGRIGAVAHVFAGTVGALISTILALGGGALVSSDRIAGDQVTAGLPTWVADLALPIGFGADRAPPGLARLAALARDARSPRSASSPASCSTTHRAMLENQSLLPWFALVIVAGVARRAHLRAARRLRAVRVADPRQPAGRAADDGVSGADDVDRASRRFRCSRWPDFCSAEGRSSERLLRVFRAWVGWAPGGTAVAAATLCAFFTLFTGGSGVTILVLGGLLLPALIGDGYRERFSIGLLTASGSLGLLFPLSLPLMLYGIVSQKASIEDLFIGGLLPGLLMLGLLATLGVREGLMTHAERRAVPAGREAMAARRGKRSGSCSCRSSSSARSSAAWRRSSSRRRWRRSTR